MNSTPPRPLGFDEEEHAKLLDVYSPRRVTEVLTASVGGTALACLVAWVLDRPTMTLGNGAVTVALVLVQVPLFLVAARAVETRNRRVFERAYFWSSQAQFSWALWCIVLAGPWLQGVVALVFAVWLVHDTRFFSRDLMTRTWSWMFPVFDAFLALLVATTGVLAWPALSTLVVLGVLQAFIAVLIAYVIAMLAEEADLARNLRREHEDALVALNRAQTERTLLYRMSSLLGRGLALSAFWHDTRNAVQSVVLDAPFIRETWEPHLNLIDDDEEREDMAEALANVEGSARALAGMLRQVKRTLGGAESLNRMTPQEIADEVMVHVRHDLRMRQVAEPPFEIAIGEADHLWIPESQVRALANIVINGALRTHEGLMLRGEPVGEDQYAFEVEDRGVDGAERAAAIARVRARLELGENHDEQAQGRDQGTEGFGVGLMFAKVQIVGRGGEITVRSNASVPGLTFRIVLRRPFGAPEEEEP